MGGATAIYSKHRSPASLASRGACRAPVEPNNESAMSEPISIRPAVEGDVAVILQFIRDLAQYEHLEHQVVATEELLREALFGGRPYAEVVLACLNGEPVGFALFFHNFSTFLVRPGIYLDDLY